MEERRKKGKEDFIRFGERFGYPSIDRPKNKVIWMHGASVGESAAMLELIDYILAQDKDLNIMVTTGTVTSARLLETRLPKGVLHQFLPLDHPICTKRFISYWKPEAAIFFESEFWPCIINDIADAKIPLMLLNGRMSDESAKRWALPVFKIAFKEMISQFSLVVAQSAAYAQVFKSLGADNVVEGIQMKNLAQKLPVDTTILSTISDSTAKRTVFVAASTFEQEDKHIAEILPAIKEKIPNLLAIIAPRDASRGGHIKFIFDEKGLNTSVRSMGELIQPDTDAYIADTMGELGLWYSVASVVFVGGSLENRGGQNFLEPMRFGRPVIVGPHLQDFAETAENATKDNAVMKLAGFDALKPAVISLLTDEAAAKKLGASGEAFVTKQNEGIKQVFDMIAPYIGMQKTAQPAPPATPEPPAQQKATPPAPKQTAPQEPTPTAPAQQKAAPPATPAPQPAPTPPEPPAPQKATPPTPQKTVLSATQQAALQQALRPPQQQPTPPKKKS